MLDSYKNLIKKNTEPENEEKPKSRLNLKLLLKPYYLLFGNKKEELKNVNIEPSKNAQDNIAKKQNQKNVVFKKQEQEIKQPEPKRQIIWKKK